MSTYKDKTALRLPGFANQNNRISFLDIIIITLVPLTLLLLNQNWIYARYYSIDEWMYVGYGYHYPDPTFYATNYKISRLPWVLLEALVRGSFPSLVSSWMLAFGVLALGNIALYFALKIPFGRLPALFAGIFMAGQTFMHANGGPDYHNTLAGAFYCLSMFLCARCARQGLPLRDLVFFGAALALTVHTNPVFINLAPILLVQYLLSYRVNHLKFPPFIPALFLGTVGAVAVTLLLGVINFSFGRQFLFFSEQLKLVSDFIADSSLQKVWWEPWSSYWFLNFPYMGIFFAGTLLSIVILAIAAPLRSASSHYAYASIFSAAYLCAVLIWVFWQSIGQTAFEPSYFAFPLGFPLAGAVAAAAATVVKPVVRPIPVTIAMLVFAALTIAGIHYADLVSVHFLTYFSWPMGVRAAVAFTIAFALLVLVRRSLWFAPAAVLLLCTGNALAVYDLLPYTATKCLKYRDAYELILDASSALRKTHLSGTKIFMFAEPGEGITPGADCDRSQITLGWLQAAIGATGFEDIAHYWTNKTLDTIEPERWKEIVATKGVIGFLTNNPARIPVLRQYVTTAGGTPGDVRLLQLREGSLELPLYILPLR